MVDLNKGRRTVDEKLACPTISSLIHTSIYSHISLINPRLWPIYQARDGSLRLAANCETISLCGHWSTIYNVCKSKNRQKERGNKESERERKRKKEKKKKGK